MRAAKNWATWILRKWMQFGTKSKMTSDDLMNGQRTMLFFLIIRHSTFVI
jgi:hypothetical protein